MCDVADEVGDPVTHASVYLVADDVVDDGRVGAERTRLVVAAAASCSRAWSLDRVAERRETVAHLPATRQFHPENDFSGFTDPQTGASERFRKWGYHFVRALYSLVVKVVCLKFRHKPHL